MLIARRTPICDWVYSTTKTKSIDYKTNNGNLSFNKQVDVKITSSRIVNNKTRSVNACVDRTVGRDVCRIEEAAND